MTEKDRNINDTAEIEAPPEQWAVVEIMGHLRLAGRITEEDRFGAKLLRVDRPYEVSPEETVWVTSYHNGSALYQLRICDEATARRTAQSLGDPRPRDPNRPPSYLTFQPEDQDEGDCDDEGPF